MSDKKRSPRNSNSNKIDNSSTQLLKIHEGVLIYFLEDQKKRKKLLNHSVHNRQLYI